MSKVVRRTANKFIKELNGNINFTAIENYLSKIGYKIIFFNTPLGDIEVARYKLTGKLTDKDATTYVNARIIFIDNNVSPEDKEYLLYHEAAHILLKHTEEKISVKNYLLMEMEADAFAYELINYTKPQRSLCILVVALITAFIFYVSYIGYQTYNSSVHADTIYVTSSGKCYHRSSCIHVKEKDCAALERKEAVKNYDPCKVCNP